ncbi:MAG: hypothetical protein JWL90_4473, partial [Chthoniobacteraceae bacterium]|nr:hypothetical protein [Chthoniobacteraceae bacterium]
MLPRPHIFQSYPPKLPPTLMKKVSIIL